MRRRAVQLAAAISSAADVADPSAAGSSTAKSPTVVILGYVLWRRGAIDLIWAETFPEIICSPQVFAASGGTFGPWSLLSCPRPTARVPPDEAKQNSDYDHCYTEGENPAHSRSGQCDVTDGRLAQKAAHLAHVLSEGIPPLTKRGRGFRSLEREPAIAGAVGNFDPAALGGINLAGPACGRLARLKLP